MKMSGKNPNHPSLGSSIKVEPIRRKKAIENIKAILAKKHDSRDLCLFTLGINTAYRANELLSIKVGDVKGLKAGDTLELKQSKNKKHRMVTINKTVAEAIEGHLLHNDHLHSGNGANDQYLFYSQRSDVLRVPCVTRLVKEWCGSAGLSDNYGSHTLRKTWGYWQYKRGTPIPLLMEAFGHAKQQQTLAYLCIQAKDVGEIYEMEL
jgi:integrase